MSYILSLLDTNHTIRSRLSNNLPYNELVLLAFSRSTPCEKNNYYTTAPKVCRFCARESTGKRALNSIQADQRDGLNVTHHRGTDLGGGDECKLSEEVVISIGNKHALQNRILQRPWFSLRHVLLVERSCQRCLTEAVSGYTALKQTFRFDPVPKYDFGTMWGRYHHRRHIVHGVGLPQRLLEQATSEDDWTMFGSSSNGLWAGIGLVRPVSGSGRR